MSAGLEGLEEAVKEMANACRSQSDQAYFERNRCVYLIARMALALKETKVEGWDAGMGQHPEDPNWDPEWRNIVYVETPEGQLSWHVHDREAPWFQFLPKTDKVWDGHTTDEKYERIYKLVGNLSSPIAT